MTLPVVQVKFVELENRTTVYPGLTAILYDKRNMMQINLNLPSSDPNKLLSANVNIGHHSKSTKNNFQGNSLMLGENDIVSQGAQGHIKYSFEIDTKYAIKVVARLSDGKFYVAQFTYGNNTNKPSYTFYYRDSSKLDSFGNLEILNHELIEKNGTINLKCPINTHRLTYITQLPSQLTSLETELTALQTELTALQTGLAALQNELTVITPGSQEHEDKQEEIALQQQAVADKQEEIAVQQQAVAAKQEEITATQAEKQEYPKPFFLTFEIDEVDDYPGVANDTNNSEHTADYLSLPYANDDKYNLPISIENDHAYNIIATAYYSDGFRISKTLDDNVHVVVNPAIIVEPYNMDAGDLNNSTALVLHVQKNTIGIKSQSRIPAASDVFALELSQDGEPMYTAQMNTSDGVTTTRTVVGEEKEFLTYTVLNSDLTKVGTSVAEDDGTYKFDAQVIASYPTLPGTSITSLEKPSNVVPGIYAHDYTAIIQVDVVNAWMAVTDVASSGDREVDMTNQITTNGYTIAPAFAIVGSFFKTADFGSGVTDGLLKDLDVVNTRFKYEISVINDENEVENWHPVKKIHQMQGIVNKTLQENYISVMTAPEQSNDDGEYANTPYTGPAGTRGQLQPRMYFSISDVFSEDQIVKVRVTIVTEEKSTNVGPKESEMCVVVEKITRYSMTRNTPSEPIFTGSIGNGTLSIPINAEGSADTHFVSAQFKSNLNAPNADITQTDANDADQEEGDNEDDDDNQFNLVVTNPNKRDLTYTVTYKIIDPNGGTVKIKSADYSIDVVDDPTSANFAVANYYYQTFNDVGESRVGFDVLFTDGGNTGIHGLNVYFSSTNDDDDASNDIGPLLVKKVLRASGDSQSNLPVILTSTPAQNSSATSGITVNDIEGNNPTTWLNFRSGTISFVPFKTTRVYGSIIDGDEEVLSENDAAKAVKPIMNIPVIDMPDNVQLVSGVVESYNGTQLMWSDDSSDYSNTSVTPSYDLVDNGANVSNNVVADSDDDSKRSYTVDTDSNPAPYSFKLDLRTKLTSDVDSKVHFSKPVTVEFTSASVDLSSATAVVKRGSDVGTLKALLNEYETTDASDIATPTGVKVFVEPNFVAPTSGWPNSSYVLAAGDYNDEALANLGLNDHIKSIIIPQGFTVQAWLSGDLAGTIAATYTSNVAQTISSISSLRITGPVGGYPKPSNLNVTEFKLVDASAENVCIAIQDGVETVLTDAQIGTTQGGVIADSSRSIITIDPDVDGWSIKNTYAVDATASPYVNLYYYKNAVAEAAQNPKGDGLNASNSFTLSQATGFGLYAVFYQNQGAKFFPYFNVFTAKTTSGTNKSWYKSKVLYYPADDHVKADTTADSGNAGLTFVYTGTDDGSLFPEITKRVKYVVRVTEGSNLQTHANDGYASEAVWLLTLQTTKSLNMNSSEGYNFRVLETGVFVSGQKLNLRYNVVSDPESSAVNVLPSSTTDPVQAVGTIHEYNLSQDYQKSNILQLLARVRASVDYTEKRGDATAEAKESQSTYLSLVSGAKVAYACASKPSVEVVGTRETGSLNNRQVIKFKLNTNGLREGIQSVVILIVKEGDHANEDADAQGAEIVLSFESTNGRLRSYLVEENGATVTTTGSTDNLGPGEIHELLTNDNDVNGFSGTTLSSTNTFILETGTLDDNDTTKLHLPIGSEWDSGVLTVVAAMSTRIGTDVNYGTVTD